MSDESLAARIARLEDREAIRTLCSRYSLSVDDHDFETLASLFAPNARYGWVNQPPQAEGREAVAALLRSRIAPGGPSFHVNHDTFVDWVDGDPTQASGLVFCHAEVCPAGVQLISAIRYRDKYVKIDNRWMFAERFLGFLYMAPVDKYPGVLTLRDRMLLATPQRAHWPAYAV